MKDDHRSFLFTTAWSCVYNSCKDHPSFNSSLRSSHITFSYHSKLQPHLCWKIFPRGLQAKVPWWQQHKAIPRGRRIAYKHRVITENITKHDDSLLKEGGKPKTGLNCLYNSVSSEKRHYITSRVEKGVLHLVQDLDRVMAKYKTII